MALGGALVVQGGKNVLGEPNAVHTPQARNVLQDDQGRAEFVCDTHNVFVEAILRISGLARSGGRVTLARRTREHCNRVEPGRDSPEVVGTSLGDIGLEDGSSWVVRPVGLRGVAVSLHSNRNAPSRLPEAMAQTSGTREEIDGYRFGITKSDPLLANSAEGDEHACITQRPARANRPAVVNEIDV